MNELKKATRKLENVPNKDRVCRKCSSFALCNTEGCSSTCAYYKKLQTEKKRYELRENLLKELNGRYKTKLQNNTYLSLDENNKLIITYHATDIIEYLPDGKIKIRNGGYYTRSTLERINEYTPFRLYQRKYEWYVENTSETLEFQTGMVL